MRGLIAACSVVLLTACLPSNAPTSSGTRDPSAQMSSMAAFDAARFSGRWHEVAGYAPEGASCGIGGLTFTPQKNGDATITEGPCADGAPRSGLAERSGPGRFLFKGAEIWVLWVDQSYQTAVIGTVEGRAHILSRRLGIADDKAKAAREILAWNGFDVTTLRATRRK